MHEPFDMTTIIFAILAIFVIWKLRSVLGERSGTEKPPANPFSESLRDVTRPPPAAEPNNIIKLPLPLGEQQPQDVNQSERGKRWQPYLKPGSNAAAALDAIAAADRSFDMSAFMIGAKTAYEMIVNAFASGNRPVLEKLLSEDVFANFAQAIDAREKRGEKVETKLVSIDKVLVEEASFTGRLAQIKLQYAASLLTSTLDANGNVIDGDPEKVQEIADRWTFKRQIDAANPNWTLCATETGH
jgi:predicted lipid-binding transport protein (Tim44 family)